MDFTYVCVLAATLMLIHQHEAVSVTSTTLVEGPLVQLNHMAHQREKRCSCENQKDKECIFFCHIGIVWVNTPGHVVPYGFGSVRLRRDVSRCVCTHSEDSECSSFCSAHRHGDTVLWRTSGRRSQRFIRAFWEKRSRHALQQQT